MRGGLGIAGISVFAVACCIGLPLLLAAGLGAAAFALMGAFAVAVLVLAVAVAPAVVRARRHRAGSRSTTGPARGLASAPDARVREAAETDGDRPLVEILYFDGCPNHRASIALVERVSRELGLDPEIGLVNVRDQEAAQRLRFLGSPTIRVAGHDVDPHAEERSDYALSCRVFRTEAGTVGQPDERWVRDALLEQAEGRP